MREGRRESLEGRSGVTGARPDRSHGILVVDDDPAITEMLREWLDREGYSEFVASNGHDGLKTFFDQRPDLSIVDLRMRGMDGFQLISRIRELSRAPILVLSAIGDEEHVVRGLDLGADDYVTKPVSRSSFLARVRSLLRRAPAPAATSNPESGYSDAGLAVDYRRYEVTAFGQPVDLRPLEFKLLAYLVRHQDRMVGHQELLNEVWGPEGGSLDSLKWYVSSLRRKLEVNSPDHRLIVNLRGLGYRYVPPPQAR